MRESNPDALKHLNNLGFVSVKDILDRVSVSRDADALHKLEGCQQVLEHLKGIRRIRDPLVDLFARQGLDQTNKNDSGTKGLCHVVDGANRLWQVTVDPTDVLFR